MRKNKKLIALVMVLAMAFCGVAYAAWTDNLVIAGTAYTGDVDAQWAYNGFPSDNDGRIFDQNNVGVALDGITYITSEIGNRDDNGKNDKLVITIFNAYPGYIASIPWKIKNTGSIPMKLTAAADPSTLAYTVTGLPTAVARINANDTVSGTINVAITDDAAEKSTYTFTVDIPVGQFNR